MSIVRQSSFGKITVSDGAANYHLFPPVSYLSLEEESGGLRAVVRNEQMVTVIRTDEPESMTVLRGLPTLVDEQAVAEALRRDGSGRARTMALEDVSATNGPTSDSQPAQWTYSDSIVTLRMGSTTRHFVVGREELPLIGSTERLPDGSLQISASLPRPGRLPSYQLFVVMRECVEDAERALAVCRAWTPTPSSATIMPSPDSAGSVVRHGDPAGRPANQAAARARAASIIVEIWGWLVMIAGAVIGIVLIGQTEEDRYYDESSHPYVAVGVGVIIGAILQGCFLIMLGAYVSSRTRNERA